MRWKRGFLHPFVSSIILLGMSRVDYPRLAGSLSRSLMPNSLVRSTVVGRVWFHRKTDWLLNVPF